jgi:alkanesulfonate monooxygenase SsuD/methylene tetrahydromethanopterin reductase-like flavin-dependent oxidoreductase (luciferase family)
VRVGVLLLPADPWPEARARVKRLEALGYDHIWTYDHLTWRRYREHEWYASMPWLTAVACVTERVRLGALVASPNFRHPVPFAKEVATLDNIAGGRLVVGLGAGGPGFDATLFGNDVLPPAERIARLTEFVELYTQLRSGDVESYSGRYFTAHEALQRPPNTAPLAIAAGGRKGLALVAIYADAWITLGDHDDVARQAEMLAEACDTIGRAPETIDRIYLAGANGDGALASVDAFHDVAGRYETLGFTDFVFHHPRAGDPVWDVPESIVEEIAAAR